MSFPTLHPENKALNLLDSALTLYPDLRPDLTRWVRDLSASIARPVDPPEGLGEMGPPQSERATDVMEYETYCLAKALCTYREKVYPGGVAEPVDPFGDHRDDLESAISRFEERLARAKPKVELDHTPDAGDYATEEAAPDPDR
ncbi:hypothetical protein [Deinococcus pimensis]|uniref:hypothetical protein n=1 Tax=Deinococcus pimensis TaxID=309888 RepID=UPI0004831D03|nr:hypothetical protein [Deinococcus pimensis]